MRQRAKARAGALALAAVACGGPASKASDAGAALTFDGPVTVVQADAGCGATQTDPHNCGGCGVDCEGGACVEGVCSAPPPGVLASGQPTPVGIALDDANVYWMNLTASTGDQVMKCAKAGCGNAPTVLASGTWGTPTRLAVHGGTVYWAVQDVLMSCPTDGCPAGPTVLSTGSLLPTDIAVGASGIYVGDYDRNALLVYPLSGGNSPTVLWSSSAPPMAIAVSGTIVYFATTGVSVVACGAAHCVTLLTGGYPTALSADSTNVYIGTQTSMSPGTVAWCPAASCPTGRMLLTMKVSYCAGIASDGVNVYFSDHGMVGADAGTVLSGLGRVAKCPLTGCLGNPTAVAGFVNFPQQIAIDGTSVYWTDFGSSTDPGGTTDGRVMTTSK